MRLARFRFLIVPIFLAFACVAAMAQQNSEITGTVTDQTGAAVPGATLTLTQNETGFVYNATSNATGGYGDAQNDKARGLHTLYSLRYSTDCEALQIRPIRGEQQPDTAIRTQDLTTQISLI